MKRIIIALAAFAIVLGLVAPAQATDATASTTEMSSTAVEKSSTTAAAVGTVYLYHNSYFKGFIKKVDTYYLDDCYNLIFSEDAVKSMDNGSYWDIVVYKGKNCDWHDGYKRVDAWDSVPSLPFWGYSLKRKLNDD